MPGRKMAHPHDLFCRRMLRELDLAADLFRHYLAPEIVKLLDLRQIRRDSPEGIGKDLSERIGDFRYLVPLKNSRRRSKAFVFVEHQSRQDSLISLRLLEYVVKALGEYARSPEYGSRSAYLPLPLVMVLYHGRRPWRSSLKVGDLFAKIPHVDPNILNFPVFLVDLSVIPTDMIRGIPPLRMLLAALQAASRGVLAERFAEVVSILDPASPGHRLAGWLESLFRYTFAICRPEGGVDAAF